jgi:hypothetical protein
VEEKCVVEPVRREKEGDEPVRKDHRPEPVENPQEQPGKHVERPPSPAPLERRPTSPKPLERRQPSPAPLKRQQHSPKPLERRPTSPAPIEQKNRQETHDVSTARRRPEKPDHQEIIPLNSPDKVPSDRFKKQTQAYQTPKRTLKRIRTMTPSTELHSPKRTRTEGQSSTQVPQKSLEDLYDEILDIIESPRPLFDALDIFEEIRFLNLEYPLDLCWLVIHTAANKGEPDVIYQLYKHIDPITELGPQDYSNLLFNLIRCGGHGLAQQVLDAYLRKRHRFSDLSLCALWKTAVMHRNVECMRLIVLEVERTREPEDLEPNFLAFLLSSLLDFDMATEALSLFERIEEWNAVDEVLDSQRKQLIIQLLCNRKKFAEAFALIKTFEEPEIVQDLCLSLFGQCFSRIRFQSDEVYT